MDLNEWNKRIYKDDNDNFIGGGLNAEEFWNEFKIESYPKFKNRCYYHVPGKWADDVRLFISAVQKELGDRIEFSQIKEKYCYLTVYYTAKDEEADKCLKVLQAECVDRLIEKGLHPNKSGNKGKENG
jgi:hypothetical protein